MRKFLVIIGILIAAVIAAAMIFAPDVARLIRLPGV
jgi:hypothetical protein